MQVSSGCWDLLIYLLSIYSYFYLFIILLFLLNFYFFVYLIYFFKTLMPSNWGEKSELSINILDHKFWE